MGLPGGDDNEAMAKQRESRRAFGTGSWVAEGVAEGVAVSGKAFFIIKLIILIRLIKLD